MAEGQTSSGGSGGGAKLEIQDRVSPTINRVVDSFNRLIEVAERVNQSIGGVTDDLISQTNQIASASDNMAGNFAKSQQQVRDQFHQTLNATRHLNDVDLDAVGGEFVSVANDSNQLDQATNNVNELSSATERLNDALRNTPDIVKIQTPVEFYKGPQGIESLSSEMAKMSENLSKIRTEVTVDPIFNQLDNLSSVEVDIVPRFEELSELDPMHVDVLPDFSSNLNIDALEVDVTPNYIETGTHELDIVPNFTEMDGVDLEPVQFDVQANVEDIYIPPQEEVHIPLSFDSTSLQDFELPQFERIPLEIEWMPVEQPEVFLTVGLDRYQQEIASANDMLMRASNSQSELNQLARELRASPSMQNDFLAMQDRIDGIRQSISALEPIDGVVSPAVNNQLESLRGSLLSIIQTQSEVANGLNDVNTQSAHNAYNRLQSQIGQVERQIRDNTVAQEQFNSSIDGGVNSTNRLVQALGAVAGAHAIRETLGTAINLSDTYSQTLARLDMMNDGLQTTAELQDAVFASAQRSRMEYQATADMVGKLGTLAGDAFGSSQEIVQFAELINKQFTLAGTSAHEASGATLQLTQALASGVLRGDELNSVMEQAPTIIQSIADYLDVTKGEIRELAAEGLITADIVKNAMFDSADAINAKFETMPKTWNQIWTGFKNSAIEAFEPVLQRINELANSQAIANFANRAVQSLYIISNAVLASMNAIGALANFIGNNWAWISPILATVATLLTIHYGRILLVRGATLLAAGAQAVWNGAVAIYQALTMNAFTLVVGAIVLVIGAVFAAVGAFNQLTGASVSGLGIIAGSANWLFTVLLNGIALVGNVVLGAVQLIVNTFQAGFFAVQLAWYGLQMTAGLIMVGILMIVTSTINIMGATWYTVLNAIELGWIMLKVGIGTVLIGILEGVSSAVNVIGATFYAGLDLVDLAWFNLRISVGNNVVGMLDSVSSFVNETMSMIRTLQYNFEMGWYNIEKGAFQMANGAVSAVDGMVNSVIGGIESMINSALNGINKMIEGVNKIPGVDVGTIGNVSLSRSNMAGGMSFSGSAPTMNTWQDVDYGAGLRNSLSGAQAPEAREWQDIDLVGNLQSTVDGWLSDLDSAGKREWEDVDLTGGVQNWLSNLEMPEAPKAWTPDYLQLKDLGQAFDQGYNKGEEWQGQIGDLVGQLGDFLSGGNSISDIFENADLSGVGKIPGAPDLSDGGAGGGGGGGSNPSGGHLDSIGEIEEEVEIDDETRKLIADVAKLKWQQNYITMTPSVVTNIDSIRTEQEYEDFIEQFNDDILDAIHDGVDGLPS